MTEKTCGTCAKWHKVLSDRTMLGPRPVGTCAYRFMFPRDDTPIFTGAYFDSPADDCAYWEARTFTAEERCRQLEEIACDLEELVHIAMLYMPDSGMTNDCADELVVACNKLKELGVRLDG